MLQAPALSSKCGQHHVQSWQMIDSRDRLVVLWNACRPYHRSRLRINIHTHTHGPFSGTTQVSQCQKGKTNLDFTEATDSERQWHKLGHMQVCTLLQTDSHTSTPPLCFYRPDALCATQPTASKHWRHTQLRININSSKVHIQFIHLENLTVGTMMHIMLCYAHLNRHEHSNTRQ